MSLLQKVSFEMALTGASLRPELPSLSAFGFRFDLTFKISLKWIRIEPDGKLTTSIDGPFKYDPAL
jgi:hypothetical protein